MKLLQNINLGSDILILDGKKVSLEIKRNIKDNIIKNNINPKLVVIQVGNDEASNVYVNSKRKACEEVGISFKHLKYDNVKEEELANKIIELNNDNSVSGILIQLPLPSYLNENRLPDLISPNKDVDGLTTTNMGNLFKGNNNLVPCTSLGVIKLLKYYNVMLL